MTTPAGVLSRVRNQLVEDTADFWTDAELYRYMSDAESEVNNMAECYRLSTAAASVTSTSGYTIPADCVSMVRVTWDGVPLKLADQRSIDALGMPGYGGTVQTGSPTHYYQYGTDMVYLWPTPMSAKTIRYYYTAEPADITTASTSFSIPQQFQNVIQDYVLYRCFTKDQDSGKAEWHKREFMQGVLDAQMKENRRRWAGGFQVVKGDNSYATYDGIV